jgi:hypothetical protein
MGMGSMLALTITAIIAIPATAQAEIKSCSGARSLPCIISDALASSNLVM